MTGHQMSTLLKLTENFFKFIVVAEAYFYLRYATLGSSNSHKQKKKIVAKESIEIQTDSIQQDDIIDSTISIKSSDFENGGKVIEDNTSFALFFPVKSTARLRNGSFDGPLNGIEKNSSYDQLVSLIRSARKSIDLCIFVFSNSNLAGELINLSADWERDIRIRVIVDSRDETVNSQVDELISHGFQVKMNPRSGSVLMHHKFMILDGETLMTGSFNWTRAAVYYNHDNILVTKNSNLIQSYQEEFDKLWKHFLPYSSNEMHF